MFSVLTILWGLRHESDVRLTKVVPISAVGKLSDLWEPRVCMARKLTKQLQPVYQRVDPLSERLKLLGVE